MAYILKRPSWYLPDSAATDETVYQNRREFLGKMAGAGILASVGMSGCGLAETSEVMPRAAAATAAAPPKSSAPSLYTLPSIEKNQAYADPGRPLTTEAHATSYTNFYEFAMSKTGAERVAKDFKLDPYTLVVDGLVRNPLKLGIEDIFALGLEERVYRFRCVEAWAMTVPWVGMPLSKILKKADVKSEGKYISFQSFNEPSLARNMKGSTYPWPYREGLTMAEAMNELTFVSVGMYGKSLPPQNGTPLRMAIPWKYGFKGGKSIVKMTITDTQPKTFWNTVGPHEYKFEANVEPDVPHPRWFQSTERRLGLEGRFKTELYNGYGAQVASLYKG
jgi:sulfoxide reductase catalytic subunit YedY